MTNLGFDNYLDIMKAYLTKFRQAAKQDEEKGSIQNLKDFDQSESKSDTELEDYKENEA